jgi:serine/threonine protein kinase
MELVDGTTLADRLARGRLPIKEALTVAAQIADALDAAHEKKVVRFRRTHRTVGSIVDFFAIETDASLLKVHISDDAALSARSKVIHRWAVAPAGPVQPFSGVLNFVR